MFEEPAVFAPRGVAISRLLEQSRHLQHVGGSLQSDPFQVRTVGEEAAIYPDHPGSVTSQAG